MIGSMQVTLKPEWEERGLGREFTSEEIARLAAEGLKDFECGETIDGEEAFRQLREQSAERRRSA